VKVRFLPAADAELADAVACYDRLSVGLGAEFAAEIRDSLGQITEFPEAWQGRATEEGAAAGERAAGPASVAVDVAETILDVEDQPRFREYVIREHRPSYPITEEVRIGAVLPARGVTL
jgi:hypothetical protein